ANVTAHIESEATYTSNDRVPFWMFANKYGSIPLPGASISLLASAHKDYNKYRSHISGTEEGDFFDWGFSINGRANIGEETDFILIEAYAKLKLGVFQLKGGRSKEVMGLVDTTLTSGAFSISGNSLGIPKVELSIPDFYALPLWDGLFAFKGNFAQGWLGEIPVQISTSPPVVETYFHQKSLYGRLGKPWWRLKLYAGSNHQVFYGNAETILGPKVHLTGREEYRYAVTGSTFSTKGIASSKIGNHLGSLDVGLDYEMDHVKLFVYRQNFYDVGALNYLANIADGLNGISLTNKKESVSDFHWKKLLFEFLYSKNQAGELGSKYTPSGDEDYYNSYIYSEGWSYKGLALGNPLFTTREAAKPGQASHSADYFINNRIVAGHLGLEAEYKDWHIVSKLSYSANYGTFGTTLGKMTLGERFPPQGHFEKVSQFSAYLEAGKTTYSGWDLGFVLALDQGELYDNSVGMQVKVGRSF
ncbi:MAG: capsule assembly Wzi family protein, partial [Leeuwenhoekiella sp.]